jgi:hypothetical protein
MLTGLYTHWPCSVGMLVRLRMNGASELRTGIDAPERAMLPGCLTLPRSEIRDLPGILFAFLSV